MTWAGVVLASLLACHPPTPVAPAAAPTAGAIALPAPPEAPPSSHPGTIVFVDLDTGEERTLPVAEVPESIAWATVDGRLVAVVRVESRVRGGSREIARYAGDGLLVDTTVGGP